VSNQGYSILTSYYTVANAFFLSSTDLGYGLCICSLGYNLTGSRTVMVDIKPLEMSNIVRLKEVLSGKYFVVV
jgi:hypothetical protein